MQLRDLIPWRAFDIETRWSPEVAAVALRRAIDEGSLLFGRGETASFVGHVRGPLGPFAEFTFKRRITYRNSFLPVIRVVVEPGRDGGTRLRVTMRLHFFVIAFMSVWMTGAIAGALGGLSAAMAGNAHGLGALVFPLFGVGMAVVPFALEAREARKLLCFIYADAPPARSEEPYR